jgi:hypothetical protein
MVCKVANILYVIWLVPAIVSATLAKKVHMKEILWFCVLHKSDLCRPKNKAFE